MSTFIERNMRLALVALIVVIVVAVAACSGAGQTVGSSPTRTAIKGAPTHSPTSALQYILRSTLTPMPPRTSRPSVTATQFPSSTATMTALPPSKTDLPPLVVCTPLEDYPIGQLKKVVSAPYDPPPMGSDDRHQGVDFTYHGLAGTTSSIMGVVVQSVLSGDIAASVFGSFPYGNLVIVETAYDLLPPDFIESLGIPEGQSLYVLYAHMQEDLTVALEDHVSACQPLGKVGHSGNTEAAHLHLEARYGPPGVRFAVMSAFVEGVTVEQRNNYRRWRLSGEFLHFDPMGIFSLVEQLFGPLSGNATAVSP